MIKSPISRQHGFTLLEVLIVVALLVTLMGMFATRLGFVGSMKISTALTNLTRTIKTAYNYAVINKSPYRIAFDLTKHEYWLEKSDRKILLATEKIDREFSERELETMNQEKLKDLEKMRETYRKSVTQQDEDGKDVNINYDSPLLKARERLMEPKYSKESIPDISEMKLPDGFIFTDIQAQHNSDKIEASRDSAGEGDAKMAYIYFLPSGFVERAVIHLGEENVKGEEGKAGYTIVTNPLNGSTQLYLEYKEISFKEKEDEQ